MFVKRNAFYRIVVITICFAILGAFIFIPLSPLSNDNPALFYSILGVFLFLYVGLCVFNEIYIHLKSKKAEKEGKEKE